jgi:acetyltransferase-like isoleucine patch superfamily enzyme
MILRSSLAHLLLRATQKLRIAYYGNVSNLRTEGTPVLYQPLCARGNGTLQFDGIVRIGVFPSPNFLETCAYIEARNPSASVRIGDGTWINNGFVAIAEHSSITIGKRVLIGLRVELLDSDFHGLQVHERRESRADRAKPVVVADDVFIGNHAKICKGVTIGEGAVIANSAVVVSDVPAHSVVGGNPAKVIRALKDDE